MRSLLLGLALSFTACRGGHGFGGGGGFAHSVSHVSSSSSWSSHSGGASTAAKVGEAVGHAVVAGLLSAGGEQDDELPDPTAPARETSGPLLDNHDPCNRCPDDFECGQCTGIAGAKCTWAPATAPSRCASPR